MGSRRVVRTVSWDIALDTNVLAYAEGVGDAGRCAASLALIERLPASRVRLPVQVLGELCRVLYGKAGRTRADAKQAALGWSDGFAVVDSTWNAMLGALDLIDTHGLQIWDALILSVASDAGCRLLLSEDLQHGFTWRGTTVVNPFLEPAAPLLQAAFA